MKNKIISQKTIEGFTFYRIDNDSLNNPRYIVHVMNLISGKSKESMLDQIDQAYQRAKKIGGKKFKSSYFGGGIVFQSFNIKELAAKLKKIVV